MYHLVGVLAPVVDDVAVLGIEVDPARFLERGQQRALGPVPADPRLDLGVGVLADIALRGVAPGEVPEALQSAEAEIFGQAHHLAQADKFGMIENCTQGHGSPPSEEPQAATVAAQEGQLGGGVERAVTGVEEATMGFGWTSPDAYHRPQRAQG